MSRVNHAGAESCAHTVPKLLITKRRKMRSDFGVVIVERGHISNSTHSVKCHFFGKFFPQCNTVQCNVNSQDHFLDDLPPGWKEKLRGEVSEPYFLELTRFLKSQYEAKKNIFPP